MKAAFVVLLALAGVAAYQTRDNCNPDAISYLLLGEHWWHGRLDLAITAYWSPLFVWLLAPLAQLLPAWIALHVAMLLSGVVFWLTARRALPVLGLSPAMCRLGDWLLVPMAAAAVGKEVSPDLLGAGLFVLAAARCLRPVARTDWRAELWTGALFGMAYLAKAANLPAALLVIGGALAVRRLAGAATTAAAMARGACVALGMALVAGPWIAMMTRDEGAFTVSTAAPRNHAVLGGPLGQREHPIWTTLHRVHPGRLTAWEDPPPELYTPWSPFASMERLQHQLAVLRDNVPVLRRRLFAADWLGLGAACALLVALLQCRRARRDDATAAEPAATPATTVAEDAVADMAPGWAWSLLPLAALAITYVPFYADCERYFYGAVPYALAAALGLCGDSALAAATGWRRRWALATVALSFLAVSLPSLAKSALGWRLDRETSDAIAIAEVVRTAGGRGPIASLGSNGHIALYAGYLLRQPFAGNSHAVDGDAQLAPVGARLVVVDPKAPAAARLAAAPGWQRLGSYRDWSVQVFAARE